MSFRLRSRRAASAADCQPAAPCPVFPTVTPSVIVRAPGSTDARLVPLGVVDASRRDRAYAAGYSVLIIDPEGDHAGLAQRPECILPATFRRSVDLTLTSREHPPANTPVAAPRATVSTAGQPPRPSSATTSPAATSPAGSPVPSPPRLPGRCGARKRPARRFPSAGIARVRYWESLSSFSAFCGCSLESRPVETASSSSARPAGLLIVSLHAGSFTRGEGPCHSEDGSASVSGHSQPRMSHRLAGA
jgi:hypothetical protein